ncbi:MAG: DUF177 domain-containing protein [Synechococcaceae cyanobacterium]|nr:DUF177 domain-containing protein [Synechococcaceae cyanobacterium]
MAPPLRPLPLSELRQLEGGHHWIIEQRIAGLDSLTPVRGALHALHHGNALELSGEAETIVTLCCDRCLQHYNHPLRAEVQELIELREAQSNAPAPSSASQGLSIALSLEGDDLDDRLDPAGRFDPEQWLFEQLHLRLPQVNRCGPDCPGPACWSSEPAAGDPRWAPLQQLRTGGG